MPREYSTGFQPLVYGQAGQLSVDIHTAGSCAVLFCTLLIIEGQFIGRGYAKVQALIALSRQVSAVIRQFYRFRRFGNGFRGNLTDR